MSKDLLLLAPGQVLFLEGAWAGVLYQIIEGEVEVYKSDKFGNDVVINTMKSGEIIGLTSFLTSSSRLASVRAKTALKLKILDSQKLEQLKATTPKWMTTIFKDMLLRIEQMNNHYIDYLSESSSQDIPVRNEFVLAATQISNCVMYLKKDLKTEVHGMACITKEDYFQLIKEVFFLSDNVITPILEIFLEADVLKEHRFTEKPDQTFFVVGELENLRNLSFILQRLVNNRSKLATFQAMAKMIKKFTQLLLSRSAKTSGHFSKKSLALQTLIDELKGEIKESLLREIITNLSEFGILKRVSFKGNDYIEYGEGDVLKFSKYYSVLIHLLKLDSRVEPEKLAAS